VEKRRAEDRAASVAAAVEHRGALDLGELLRLATREARQRPGSVVLRVARRLIVLAAADLERLEKLERLEPMRSEAGHARALTEVDQAVADQIERVIQSWAAVRADGDTRPLATRIAPSRSVVEAAERETAQLAELMAGRVPPPRREIVPAELLALREKLSDLLRWPILEESQTHLIPHDVLMTLVHSLERCS